jgi:flagellar basal body-associated protein FliL
MDYNYQNNYSKKSLWKWILLCAVIAIVACGLIYYFFFANKGGYTYNTQSNNYDQTTPTVQNDQQLMSSSQSLDVTDVNQIDSGLNQNDADANAF